MTIKELGADLCFNGSQMVSLEHHGIYTVSDLLKKNMYEILSYRGFGKKTVDKMVAYLKLHGFNTTEFERIPKRYKDKECLKKPRCSSKPVYNLEVREENGYIIPTITFEGIPLTKEQFETLQSRLRKTTGKTTFMDVINTMMLSSVYHSAK